MKKTLIGITILTLIAFGAIAYAHGPGWVGGGYHHMTGLGYGGHMIGWTDGYDQKFLDETVEARKQLHDKQFEYAEAIRNPNTKPETITELEKEITDLQEKLYAKAPRGKYKGFKHCWEY